MEEHRKEIIEKKKLTKLTFIKAIFGKGEHLWEKQP
jgi:hypothetical protein